MSLPSAKELAHRLAGVVPMMTAAEFQVRLEIELIAYAEAIRQAYAEAVMTERKDEERGTPRSDGYIEGCLSCRDAINHLDLTGTSPRKETP